MLVGILRLACDLLPSTYMYSTLLLSVLYNWSEKNGASGDAIQFQECALGAHTSRVTPSGDRQ